MAALPGRQRGFILVSAAAAGWSTAGLFTRFLTEDALTIAAWRGFFSTLALTAYLLWRHRGSWRAAFTGFGRVHWVLATISTFTTLLSVAALLNTTVANVVAIEAASPFMAAGLAWLLLGEPAGLRTLLASAVALAGVMAMVYPDISGHGLYGDLAALAVTIGMALITVIARRQGAISMIPATLVSAVQLTALGLLLTRPASVPVAQIGTLALFGVVQAAAFAAYIEGARHLASASTALIGAADVPLAPLWVWLVFSEAPPPVAIIGAAAICGAVVLDMLGGAFPGRRVTARPQP
jgi:drug/metabolite transporter (DMT)-like permease